MVVEPRVALPVRRARGGAPQHSVPVPPLHVGHPLQCVVAGSQEEKLSPNTGLQVDARLKLGIVNPYGIWVEVPGGIFHMARKKKRGSTHPYPNPSLHHQGGVSKSR
jgi:hypothetical protein